MSIQPRDLYHPSNNPDHRRVSVWLPVDCLAVAPFPISIAQLLQLHPNLVFVPFPLGSRHTANVTAEESTLSLRLWSEMKRGSKKRGRKKKKKRGRLSVLVYAFNPSI